MRNALPYPKGTLGRSGIVRLPGAFSWGLLILLVFCEVVLIEKKLVFFECLLFIT